MMKKKFVLIGTFAWALITLLPMNLIARDDNRPVELKVMSYNIRNGEAKDGTNAWQYRAPATMMMLEDQKPDIFGIQEAFDYQVAAILTFTEGYKAVGVGREDGKHEGEHMSIFYNKKRLKLQRWGTYWLSETPDKPSMGWDAACRRTATWALMKDKKSGKKFYFVNTHLDHVGVQARKKGLELIVANIAKMNKEGYPMILTGDFNVTLEDPCLEALEGVMKSARATAVKTDNSGSFNNWGKQNPESPIDYIYYKGFSSCPVFEVVKKSYYERKFVSDHFPVSAVLIF